MAAFASDRHTHAPAEAPGLGLQIEPAARDTPVGVEQAAFQPPLDQSPQDVPQRTLPHRACEQASASALGIDYAATGRSTSSNQVKMNSLPTAR